MERNSEFEIALRVTLVDPPVAVQFCLQGRNGEWVDQILTTGGDLSFDLVIRVSLATAGGNTPRFLGRFVQGPPANRFLYVCSGTYAGDIESCWARRAKIPLAGITSNLIGRVRACRKPALLEARIKGKAKDGGPVCATVPLLGDGWQMVRR